MNALNTFCRQILSRSAEHAVAMRVLESHQLWGVMVSILRLELDSMIRVIYLLNITDMSERQRLIKASVAGEPWTIQSKTGRKVKILDVDMKNISGGLHGWVASVYKFGCYFIHLSSCHDYNDRDPFVNLPPDEQRDILQHLRYYHHGPQQQHPSFDDLKPYLHRVFEKISENLKAHLKQLEDGDTLVN